jgi:hypothetical protein
MLRVMTLDKDSFTAAARMQGYALLLMGNLPLTLKKRLIFDLLNELEVRLSEADLKEVEAFYAPTPVYKGVTSVGTYRPVGPMVPPIFCYHCTRTLDVIHDSTFGPRYECSGCSKTMSECDCEPRRRHHTARVVHDPKRRRR